MKIKWSFMSAVMAILLILSACGTSDVGNENPDGENNDEATVDATDEKTDVVEADGDSEGSVGEGTLDEDIEEEASEDKADTTETPTEDSEVTTPPTTTENPQTENIVNSDNQDYAMNLMESYELTSEEPGRDILNSKEDDRHFMRIETMANEDGTYDYLKDNMLVVLEASSNGETPVEISDDASLPTGDSITKALSYSVNTETGPVTGIIFERGELIIRLTIFDSINEDYFSDFLNMGETVSHK